MNFEVGKKFLEDYQKIIDEFNAYEDSGDENIMRTIVMDKLITFLNENWVMLMFDEFEVLRYALVEYFSKNKFDDSEQLVDKLNQCMVNKKKFQNHIQALLDELDSNEETMKRKHIIEKMFRFINVNFIILFSNRFINLRKILLNKISELKHNEFFTYGNIEKEVEKNLLFFRYD